MKLNPDYSNAELELTFLTRTGGLESVCHYPVTPMRFWKKDQIEVLNAFRKSDWETLNKLQVPPYTTP